MLSEGVAQHAAKGGRLTRSDLSDYLHLTTGQVDDLRSLVATGA